MKVLHAALLTGLLSAIALLSPDLAAEVFHLSIGQDAWFPVFGVVFLVNTGLALLIARHVIFQSRRDLGLFGFVSAVAVAVGLWTVASVFLGVDPSDYRFLVVYGAAMGIFLGGLPALIGAVLSPVLERREVWRPNRVDETISAVMFEVPVSVPSVGKTVTLEVSPDHTVESLVETLVSTLKLPKGRTYAIKYRTKLISQPDFGKSLGAFQIKEGSKLSLRVVD